MNKTLKQIGDERKKLNYSVWDNNNIKGFFGEYMFLSNFWECEVYFDGLTYPSSECAYQAAKVIREIREPFTKMKPWVSKTAWQEVTPECILPDWDENKYRIMDIIVLDKFTRNKDLKQKLLDTDNRYLEETNHWSDLVWGVDYKTGRGSNWLGKILMGVRSYLRD